MSELTDRDFIAGFCTGVSILHSIHVLTTPTVEHIAFIFVAISYIVFYLRLDKDAE